MRVVYSELHKLAAGYMKRERPDHTLQASALVNEAYLRLVGDQKLSWESRAHFYVMAARTMRRILIDHSRRRAAGRRAADMRVDLEAADRVQAAPSDGLAAEDMLALHNALERLAGMDERQARIVELRFFGGLSVEETASVMGISEKTVKRDWASARAWLLTQLDS